MPAQTKTLELEDRRHLRWSRREWVAERCGMTLIGLVLAAALGGLSGSGPLSHRTRTSANRTWSIKHDAIQRYGAPAELAVRFSVSDAEPTDVRLGLSRAFTDRVVLEEIVPTPEWTELQSGRLVYGFRTANLRGPGTIFVRYRNNTLGSLRYAVELSTSQHGTEMVGMREDRPEATDVAEREPADAKGGAPGTDDHAGVSRLTISHVVLP